MNNGEDRGIVDKCIVFFGAGLAGKRWLEVFDELGISVDCFIDNNIEKQGQTIGGIQVYSPDEIVKSRKECLFVITVYNTPDSLRNQLISLGVNVKDIFSLDELCNTSFFRGLINERVIDRIMDKTEPHYELQADSSMLRILYDDQVFSMQKYGGISRYIFEIAEGLGSRNDVGVDLFKGVNISEIRFDNNVNNLFSYKAYGKVLEEYDIRRAINRDIIKQYMSGSIKYDIYHPTYYEDYGIKNYSRKVITVHDMIHELYGLDRATIKNKKKIIKSSDGIIAVSENTKRDLISILDVPEDRIKVIYHANSLVIEVDDDRLINEPYILYVGERRGYKNYNTLAKAYAKSAYRKDMKLVCFGGGAFRREEITLFEDLGIQDMVIQKSGNDHMLANLYYHAEVFVYPSKYEGFGIPLLEAMHYGVPIITGNVSSLPEVAGNAVEYFNPNSFEDLECKINGLLDNKSRRDQLICRGYQREKLFSWGRAVKETYDYYKSLL